MKKILSIIGAGILLMGGVISTAFTSAPKDIKEAQAKEYTRPTYTGLYERVESASEVVPGKSFILATDRGYVFDGVGGNPAYAHADPSGVTMFPDYDTSIEDYYQDNTKFIYLHSKSAVILNCEAGASGYSSSYVSFKADFYVGSTRLYQHYLGENDEENYDGRHDYDSIGWFLNGFGMRPTKDGKSTWEVTYDSTNNKMLIRKVSKTDTTSYICYDHSGARHRFYFGSAESSHVNLYKKVDNDNLYRSTSPSPIHLPNKTSYVKGDSIQYDGLIIGYKIKRGEELYDDYVLKYNDNTSCFFSKPTVVSDSAFATVTVFNKIGYIIDISVTDTASHYIYNEVTTLPADLRGTYFLVTRENLRILDPSKSTGSKTNYTEYIVPEEGESIFESHTLESNMDRLDASVIKIVRTKINDNWYYHAMNYLGQYLCIGSEEVFSGRDEYYLDYTDTPTVNNAITMTTTSFKIGDYYLAQEEGTIKVICFTKTYSAIGLFKLSTSTNVVNSQVEGFVSYFLNQTAVCGDADESENEFEKISDELWENIEEEFNKLSCDAQGIFASTTYTHDAEVEESKENVVDRYDYIISKYGKKDFMLRGLANTYENNFSSSSLKMLNNKDTTVAIIVIAISVTIIGTTLGLFILKKRKYN